VSAIGETRFSAAPNQSQPNFMSVFRIGQITPEGRFRIV
jgi:hypothetical protein